MASIDAEIQEIAKRQEAGATLMLAIAERLEALSEQIAVVVEWAQEPASTGLTDAIDALALRMERLSAQMEALPERIAAEVRRSR